KDFVAFNRSVIEEEEVSCLWLTNGTPCNDLVRGKDLRVHLHDRHDITSDAQIYQCQWYNCTSHPMRRAALERYIKEQHTLFEW
ncbi:hypothetical protein V8E55_005809, partial [Tylopilus felleus]